jgi:hypothetical protein
MLQKVSEEWNKLSAIKRCIGSGHLVSGHNIRIDYKGQINSTMPFSVNPKKSVTAKDSGPEE